MKSLTLNFLPRSMVLPVYAFDGSPSDVVKLNHFQQQYVPMIDCLPLFWGSKTWLVDYFLDESFLSFLLEFFQCFILKKKKKKKKKIASSFFIPILTTSTPNYNSWQLTLYIHRRLKCGTKPFDGRSSKNFQM